MGAWWQGTAVRITQPAEDALFDATDLDPAADGERCHALIKSVAGILGEHAEMAAELRREPRPVDSLRTVREGLRLVAGLHAWIADLDPNTRDAITVEAAAEATKAEDVCWLVSKGAYQQRQADQRNARLMKAQEDLRRAEAMVANHDIADLVSPGSPSPRSATGQVSELDSLLHLFEARLVLAERALEARAESRGAPKQMARAVTLSALRKVFRLSQPDASKRQLVEFLRAACAAARDTKGRLSPIALPKRDDEVLALLSPE